MCRSCGIPDLIHIKNESHLGMDGTRGDRSRGASRAGAVLPGRESSSGVSRDEQKQGHPVHQDEYFQIRSFTASEQERSRVPDQRSGRLISGTQSFKRRLSSQNRCSFSRAGSSQDPSPGFCSNGRREEASVTRVFQKASHTQTSEMIHNTIMWLTELYTP